MNLDPNAMKVDVTVQWPSAFSIELGFDVTLLQPSYVAVDVDAATVHVSVVK